MVSAAVTHCLGDLSPHILQLNYIHYQCSSVVTQKGSFHGKGLYDDSRHRAIICYLLIQWSIWIYIKQCSNLVPVSWEIETAVDMIFGFGTSFHSSLHRIGNTSDEGFAYDIYACDKFLWNVLLEYCLPRLQTYTPSTLAKKTLFSPTVC